MAMGKRVRVGLIIVAVVLVGGGGTVAVQRLGKAQKNIPTARVKRGNLEVRVYTTGELRPARTGMLVAPPVSGTMQIVRLAQSGSHVNEGDVVIEFDPSEQEYNLEQNRS